MIALCERIGKSFLTHFQSFWQMCVLAVHICYTIMQPSTYNRAVYEVLIRQIYFTAVQIVPLFFLTALLFGGAIVGGLSVTLVNLGLTSQIGTVIVKFVMDELAPFVTVLLLALRSASAMNTEIAVMKVNHELNSLEMLGINPLVYLYVPRVIAGMVSVFSLSLMFATVSVIMGYFFARFLGGLNSEIYIGLLVEASSLGDMGIIFLKCLLMGIFIAVIPIRYGLMAQNFFTIPIAVLQGMVKVFIAILTIEVVTLLWRLFI